MTRPLRFGIVADCQYEPIDDEIFTEIDGRHVHYKFHRLTQAKLREAVATFNQAKVEFVVHLGDFTQGGLRHAAALQEELVKLNMPLYHALGNHDFDTERDTAAVLAAYDMKHPYYSWTHDKYRMIVLDTNDCATYRHDTDAPMYIKAEALLKQCQERQALNAYAWNGGVSSLQLQWLQAELADASAHAQKVILFSHHPVFPLGSLTLLNAPEVLAVIDSYRDTVLAYINGHNHFGSVGVRAGMPYITVPALLHGESNAYGIASVDTDKLCIEGYGRVLDMEFERTVAADRLSS